MRASIPLLVSATIVFAAAAASSQSASYEPPDEELEAELFLPSEDDDVSVIEVARDGTIIFAEINGPVFRLAPGAAEPEVIHRPPVVRGPEWGITGLALAPEYEDTGDFFLAYATADADVDPMADDAMGEMRLVRVHDGEEIPIYTYEATRFHNSGRIVVHDGHIFLSRGEQNHRSQAQDPDNPAGNILRMTLEGEPAADNPRGDFTYAWGFRNPFGLAWDPEREWLVEAEVGHLSNEEINVVLPGENYGWPICEGPCDPPNASLTDPIITYPEVVTPTDIVIIGTDYVHGAFSGGTLHHVYETESGWASEVIWRHPKYRTLIGMDTSPDKTWIYAGSSDGMWRIRTPQAILDTVPPPDEDDPQTSDPPTQTSGPDVETPPTGGPTPPSGEDGGIDVGRDTPAAGLALVALAAVAAAAATGGRRGR